MKPLKNLTITFLVLLILLFSAGTLWAKDYGERSDPLDPLTFPSSRATNLVEVGVRSLNDSSPENYFGLEFLTPGERSAQLFYSFINYGEDKKFKMHRPMVTIKTVLSQKKKFTSTFIWQNCSQIVQEFDQINSYQYDTSLLFSFFYNLQQQTNLPLSFELYLGPRLDIFKFKEVYEIFLNTTGRLGGRTAFALLKPGDFGALYIDFEANSRFGIYNRTFEFDDDKIVGLNYDYPKDVSKTNIVLGISYYYSVFRLQIGYYREIKDQQDNNANSGFLLNLGAVYF